MNEDVELKRVEEKKESLIGAIEELESRVEELVRLAEFSEFVLEKMHRPRIDGIGGKEREIFANDAELSLIALIDRASDRMGIGVSKIGMNLATIKDIIG